MTDRELLIYIYGLAKASSFHGQHVSASLANLSAHKVEEHTKDIVVLIDKHFDEVPSQERLALEERVKNLEAVVSSKGYNVSEEIEAA